MALVVAFPAAALVQSADGVAVFLVFVVGLGLLYGTIYGPLAAFWSELFDTRYRSTALSTLYQVSGVLAPGLTPLFAARLVTEGGGTLWWVTGYNVAVAAISLTCAHFLPETQGRDLDASIAAEPSGRVLDPSTAPEPGAHPGAAYQARPAERGPPRHPP